MNLHVFCLLMSIMLLLQNALSKTLPEAGEIDSDPEEQDNSDVTEAVHEARHRNLRHPQASHMKRHNRRRRANHESQKKTCAVMYKNGEPVGILQPYKDSYQLLPIHSGETIPVDISPLGKEVSEEGQKRDADAETAGEEEDETEGKGEELAPFADEKYPYIFAKFKIDSKVEKDGNQKSRNLAKREYKNPSLFSERHVNSLKSALTRLETNDAGAEAELRGILNDMGLIDDSPIEKRDAELLEDEDLEHGTNKINLIKVENDKPEVKRSNSAKKTKHKPVTKHYAMIDFPEPKFVNEDEYIDQYVKKHPDQFNQPEAKGKEKRSDNLGEQMELQIKQRLQKIKEEVKSEIEAIKGNSNNEELEEEAEQEEDEGEQQEGKSQRRKRDAVDTLVEEETSDVDPVLFGENNLVPHIRRRRSLDDEKDLEPVEEDVESGNAHQTNKEESDLKNEVKADIDETRESTGEASLIIDLDKDNDENKDKELLEEKSPNLDTISTSQYVATTTPGYLTRNLKEIQADANKNYEDLDQDFDDDSTNNEDEKEIREKKACKCTGKDCKCDSQPKPSLGEDGSSLVYFDGAPIRLPAPYRKVEKDSGIVSMQFLPQPRSIQKRISSSDHTNLAEIKTKILRGFRDGGYVLDVNPDVYKITQQNSLDTRTKRNSLIDLVAIHGGAPVLDHLVAIRERSMLPRMRVKRRTDDGDQTEQQLTLTDMSDEDLFGALPQSYEGELARYKRVKRAKT